MTIIRISVAVGLAVFGILMLAGMDAVTAVFRAFIVFMGLAALMMLYSYLSAVIKPSEPAQTEPELDEEIDPV